MRKKPTPCKCGIPYILHVKLRQEGTIARISSREATLLYPDKLMVPSSSIRLRAALKANVPSQPHSFWCLVSGS